MMEGSYKLSSLINILIKEMNSTPRINSTTEFPLYNIFTINSTDNLHKITFNRYNDVNLPNSLSITKILINSVYYYSLKITNVNNILKANDTIIISNSEIVSIFGTTNVIQSQYINKQFTIYSVDSLSGSYTVLLSPIDQISVIPNPQTNVCYGGANIIVREVAQFQLLFTENDTLGDVLGFKNVGNSSSIFRFSTTT